MLTATASVRAHSRSGAPSPCGSVVSSHPRNRLSTAGSTSLRSGAFELRLMRNAEASRSPRWPSSRYASYKDRLPGQPISCGHLDVRRSFDTTPLATSVPMAAAMSVSHASAARRSARARLAWFRIISRTSDSCPNLATASHSASRFSSAPPCGPWRLPLAAAPDPPCLRAFRRRRVGLLSRGR